MIAPQSPLSDAEVAALACPAGTHPGPVPWDATPEEIARNSGGHISYERHRTHALSLAERLARSLGDRHGWTEAQRAAAAGAALRIPCYALNRHGRAVGCLVEPVLHEAARRVAEPRG